ncbi:hypothetical protein BT67DRAFT_451188 [Trichocladium antarcticum]|uniref:Nucleoporin Nup159/Nup146 N-terminal domain-containing protein n=1 Tax=Trichocladium antarcticum TaxID=1450529 RepID=A0AAN6ZC21_9PEZI|nr:hypothetical protein BT67DRAFT_451188 [Trichocladium antarcticum]
MAFSFGNAGNAMMSAPSGGAGGVNQGSDLEVIQTEGLGFLSIAGDAKVQLTSKWSPAPAPTASLLSIASRIGLVAAAGPDAIHIATTESVRKAFEAERDGDSEARPFTPQAKVPLPIRISQLTFTADEQYLILSAETGGGLAVYDVQALTQGATQSAFELNTNSETLRALVPNPMPEAAAFCAVVTNNGNLYMANLAEQKLVSGPSGPTLRSQVACAAWSTKGKQLVAGMADGTIYQMKPDGTEKGHIPKPPSLGNYHVASITWLENHVFLTVHNSTNGSDPSVFHIITRQQPPGGAAPSFTFQKLTDPVEPFTPDKAPHHSVLRLKDFPPNLQDLLLVSSTATEGVGLLSRSKTPLASDKPVEAITNVFTTTELADDSRRALLPMSEDYSDTYPIGTALDLSSKDKVYKPIPTDEIEFSPGPLPGMWVLSNEGVLASWWIVYNESIRGGTTYPGIGAGDAVASAVATPTPALSVSTAFGSPANKTPAFGSPATPAFGGSSALGSKPSPWSTTTGAPAFGTSTFGSTPAAPAFGQSSSVGMGAKASLWATGSTSGASPAFGQTGFAGSAPGPGKLFGGGTAAPASGGFAGFASKPGFGTLGSDPGSTNIFGSTPGGALPSSAPEVSMGTTAFPPPSAKVDKPAVGSSPFVLGTTFKADPSTAHDNEKPKDSMSSLFGSGFQISLDDASEQRAGPESRDNDMESTTPPAEEKPQSAFIPESTTPTSTPAPQKFSLRDAALSGGSNIFGSRPSGGMSNIFGTPTPASTDPFKPKPASSIFGTPKIKQEDEDKETLSRISAAPLPPDSTSKTVFQLSSSSSESGYSPQIVSKTPVEEEAPLPPDFLTERAPSEEEPLSTKPGPGSAPPARDLYSTKLKSKPEDTKLVVAEDAPLPLDSPAKPPSRQPTPLPAMPDSASEEGLFEEEEGLNKEEGEEDEEEKGEDEGEKGEGSEQEEGEEGEEGEEASDDGSEGSGIDVAKDLSPTTRFGDRTPGITPQSSFGGIGDSTFSAISPTEAEPSLPLFGEIAKNAPPLFPKTVPQSPRSPSPVRGTQRRSVLRPNEPARSHTAPVAASQTPGRQSTSAQQGLGLAASQRKPRPVDVNVQAQRKLAKKKRAEERVLVDPEEEGIRQILHSKLEPSLHMDEFLVVDSKLEVLEKSDREEVPTACETLWRDINRTIDRLGLNSRALQSFVLGHTTLVQQSGRHAKDLETPDNWVLAEADDLGNVIEDELGRDLERGRIHDVEGSEAALQSLAKDLAKLRAKEEDMRKIISAQIDPEQLSVAKTMPLSAEQATQQNELRRSHAAFSKLLAETEEALTLLKAKMASAGGGRAPVPTVEAIIRTIGKMTSMAEKRSGDIDVLEDQMRRLRLGSANAAGTPGTRSREGSPFAVHTTTTPQQQQLRRSLMMSPERGSVLRDSLLASSVASYGGVGRAGTPSPRKKMSMYSEEDKRELRAREGQRRATLQMLRKSLARGGPNVSRLRDDE